MFESFGEFAVVVGILAAAWVVTSVFTRVMYKRCAACGALNAHRRVACRVCGVPFAPPGGGAGDGDESVTQS